MCSPSDTYAVHRGNVPPTLFRAPNGDYFQHKNIDEEEGAFTGKAPGTFQPHFEGMTAEEAHEWLRFNGYDTPAEDSSALHRTGTTQLPTRSASPDRPLSPREVRAANDVMQFCQDWRNAIADIWEAINRGLDPAEATSERLLFPDGKKQSRLGFLWIATTMLAEAASIRYHWFDIRPFWELYALIESWSAGNRSEGRRINLFTLSQSISPRLMRLQEAAMVDIGLIRVSPPPAPRPEIDFHALATALRKDGKRNSAKLVEYMADKTEATAEEIAKHVHDEEETSDRAIWNNAKRTSDSLAEMKSRLSFRFASGRMYREISPE